MEGKSQVRSNGNERGCDNHLITDPEHLERVRVIGERLEARERVCMLKELDEAEAFRSELAARIPAILVSDNLHVTNRSLTLAALTFAATATPAAASPATSSSAIIGAGPSLLATQGGSRRPERELLELGLSHLRRERAHREPRGRDEKVGALELLLLGGPRLLSLLELGLGEMFRTTLPRKREPKPREVRVPTRRLLALCKTPWGWVRGWAVLRETTRPGCACQYVYVCVSGLDMYMCVCRYIARAPWPLLCVPPTPWPRRRA